MRPSFDVAIVGGRVAGAATGMLLARAGHRVVIIDRATFPSDTLSTHAIARTGVVQLHRWGLLDAVVESGAPRITDIVFHHGGEHIERRIKDRFGVDFLVAPRRYALDELLVDAARQAGAQVATESTVTDVIYDRTGRAVGVEGRTPSGRFHVDARFVVGADGLRSRVARSVGAPVIEEHPAIGATHYGYFRGAWPAMEYYIDDRAFAGIFPTHGGEACVWVCTPANLAQRTRRALGSPQATFDRLLQDIDGHLRRRLLDARQTSPIRGVIAMPNLLRQAAGPGWALVGDAGFHRDPITGHGISDAFRDAELLAEALDRSLRGDRPEAVALADYSQRREALLREVFDLTNKLVAFPAPDRFLALQKQLGQAIDHQAAQLASLTPSAVG